MRKFRTIRQIERLRRIARKLDFEAPDRFWIDPPEQLQAAYNGIGADWQSNLSRELITLAYGAFEAVALVHDYEGTYCNDGTKAGCRAWNARFYRNGKKIAANAFFLLRPRRYRQNLLLYIALRQFGLAAWQSAYEAQLAGRSALARAKQRAGGGV